VVRGRTGLGQVAVLAEDAQRLAQPVPEEPERLGQQRVTGRLDDPQVEPGVRLTELGRVVGDSTRL
jgi:hypothetical protein